MKAGSSEHHGSQQTPAPLTEQETRDLWRSERLTMRLGAFAATVLAAGLALPHLMAGAEGARYALMLLALAIIAVATVMQLRIRCPKCSARLGTQSALLLPERCAGCGVTIRHPKRLDGELDV
ncbi:MAG: hypothetical protein AB7E80_16320 [Hyphomicrobiaceae bacterium]